jgi:NitT/TauT family transport system substrate-binding protein
MRSTLGLAALFLLAACSAGPSARPEPAAVGAAAPTSPSRLEHVRLAYGAPSGGFATPWMAKDAGLFERYGLDVEIVYISSSPTMLQSMLAGELQFGELAAPASMNAYLESGEVVWITGAVNRPILYVVGLPEIQRLEDLRGRAVGVTRLGTTTHTFMKLALRSVGLDAERDVQILQTGGTPETLAALQTGRIAAGVTGPPTHLQAVQAGMRIVADLADLGIAWPFGGSITTKSYIASHPETVRGYVKAYTEAIYLLRTDRERSIAVLQKGGQVDDPQVAEQAWEAFRDRYTLPPYPDVTAMEAVVQEELAATNPKAAEIPPTAYFDDRFVRELDESGFVRGLGAR